jgi:aspartyl-tRNA(Asn)/glutamyl-tRNA(Gln) amidotransferase subunit A
MHRKTIAQLIAGLKKKEFSCVELTQHYLQRIKQANTQLNSFITITDNSALELARAIDTHSDRSNHGSTATPAAANANKPNAASPSPQSTAAPLRGIPIAYKDIFCTEGVRTSCGSKMLDNFIAPYDATVVARLKRAGTIMLGKTNMDEFAMGSSNENSYYGVVKNPWDLTRVAGGSSGGSAAAVAARLVPAALGTDTGGSVRQPAAFCGITGLKPTYGSISRYGIVAFASSLDQAGIFAPTAEDIAIILTSAAGFDDKDSTSATIATPNYQQHLGAPLTGLRVGLPKEYFDGTLDQEIARAIDVARQELQKLGATFKEISLPNSRLAISAYYVVAPAECSSNLARYDGVRYGYRCTDPKDLQDLYIRSRSEAFGDEVKRRIMIGTYVLSAGYYDAFYTKAQKVRKLIKNDFLQAFDNEVDVILAPTTPTTAFKIGEKAHDPVNMYLSDVYTVPVNMAGLPGLSLPIGFCSKGLPIGMQLIGNYFNEALLLNMAHQYQMATDWHQKNPSFDPANE